MHVFADISNPMKDQCKYLVYGNGEHNQVIESYMSGMLFGMMIETPYKDSTQYFKDNMKIMIYENAHTKTKDILKRMCKIALDNMSENEFRDKFMLSYSKLMKKNN